MLVVSELFRSGVPAHVVQAPARHEGLKTTQRYADLDTDDLRAGIDSLDRRVDQGNASTLTKGSG